MKEAESLSVILPTYNSNVSALEAVLVSLENQSYKDFVCYLVDDSDDEHSEAIKTISKPFPFLRYRQGFKKGIASALNLGISLSRGEYIARVDDSDINHIDRFEKQIAFLLENPNVDVLGTNISYNYQGRKFFSSLPSSDSEIKSQLNWSCPIAHPSIMAKAELLRSNPYDEKFQYSEDLELWLRLRSMNCSFSNLADICVEHTLEHVIRSKSHYRYNFLARRKNVRGPVDYLSCLLIATYELLPTNVKAGVYKALKFR